MSTANSHLMLKQALIKYRELDIQKALDSNIDYSFSPKFEKAMLRLCQKQKHKYWHLHNTAGKRTAITLAAVLAIFSSMMCVQATREPIIHFFTSIHDTFVDLFIENTHEIPVPQEIETVYTISVPENYTVVEEVTDLILHSTVWEKTNGAQIVLNQGTLNTAIAHDNEHSNYEILQGDQEIEIHYFDMPEHNIKSCYWIYQGYSFSLFIQDSQLTKDDCVNMINSIIPV